MILSEMQLSQANQLLQQGEVLAYPTEAVWGLGCDPFNLQAFEQLLTVKNRPIDKGVIILAADVAQVQSMLDELSAEQQQRILASWQPQHERATTWLLPHKGQIPHWITGQHELVAVRVTNHPLCKAMCEHFAGFIVSTSANPAGLAPAKTLEQAQNYFAEQVHYVDGELGQCQQPSRIIHGVTGEIIRD